MKIGKLIFQTGLCTSCRGWYMFIIGKDFWNTIQYKTRIDKRICNECYAVGRYN